MSLAATKREKEFDSLNALEKYAFLYETFWSKVDFRKFGRFRDPDIIDNIIEAIADSSPGDELTNDSCYEWKPFDPFFTYSEGMVIRCFHYFGFCNYRLVPEEDKKPGGFSDPVWKIVPTEFGVNICKILQDQLFIDWNIPHLKVMFVNGADVIPGVGHPGNYYFYDSIKRKK